MKLGLAAAESRVRETLPSHLAGETLPLTVQLAVNAGFNGVRFGMAALLYWLLTRRRQRDFSAPDVSGGLLVGLFFAAGMFAQITGLRYTAPSVSGFLTALVVVFAPLAQRIIFRRAVSPRIWLAVAAALAGMVVLSQPDATATGTEAGPITPLFPFMGEALTVIGAVFFTGQLLVLDSYGKRAQFEGARLTIVMFLATSAFSLLLSLLLGGAALCRGQVLSALATDPTVQWSMLGMTVFSSVVALHLMNSYQPRISPAAASVVYCLEPLFATLFSVLFRTEGLRAATFAGGALISAAVLIAARAAAERAVGPASVPVGEGPPTGTEGGPTTKGQA